MTTKKFSFDLSSRQLFSNERFLISVVDALVRDASAPASSAGGQKIRSFAERLNEAQPKAGLALAKRRKANEAARKAVSKKSRDASKK